MEIVVSAALIAVGFGAAATWLIATRLPAEWIERSRTDGRYAALSTTDGAIEEPDPRGAQARIYTRRVRRARVRALPAAALMRTLRAHPGESAPACKTHHRPDDARRQDKAAP
ncbi:MAG: hypothetical protein LBV73_04880 [Paraburkholderia sp.]|jgi:pimeloyl-ACP methyl ester carboxylesterase|nr:hypothetical protein [Paraburkholderia sp.]